MFLSYQLRLLSQYPFLIKSPFILPGIYRFYYLIVHLKNPNFTGRRSGFPKRVPVLSHKFPRIGTRSGPARHMPSSKGHIPFQPYPQVDLGCKSQSGANRARPIVWRRSQPPVVAVERTNSNDIKSNGFSRSPKPLRAMVFQDRRSPHLCYTS